VVVAVAVMVPVLAVVLVVVLVVVAERKWRKKDSTKDEERHSEVRQRLLPRRRDGSGGCGMAWPNTCKLPGLMRGAELGILEAAAAHCTLDCRDHERASDRPSTIPPPTAEIPAFWLLYDYS
jgi:hypothetical protein